MKKNPGSTGSTLVLAAAVTFVLTGCTPTNSLVESTPDSTMSSTSESMPTMEETAKEGQLPSEPENEKMDAAKPEEPSYNDSSEFYLDDYSIYVERGSITQEQADQLMEADNTVSDIYLKADEEADKVNEGVSSIRELTSLSDTEFYYNSYVDLAITQEEADIATEAENNRNMLYNKYSDLFSESQMIAGASDEKVKEFDNQIAEYEEILAPITDKINSYVWKTEYQGYVESGILSQDEADQIVSLLIERDNLWSEENSVYMDDIPDEDQKSEFDALYNDINALTSKIDELTKNITVGSAANEICDLNSGI